MKPSVALRVTVWLLASFVGAAGWWIASGVLSGLYGLPRASYGQALGVQVAAQLILQSVVVAFGAFAADGE